ncbi:MAG TPA: MBL fold metallo-hydrolase [Bacillales bacterium]|nr:MBL fold metallo-hydrolase [Bacillales bacterium]
MKIADGVYMLENTTGVMGQPNTVHPILIASDDAFVLIDTGFTGQFPQLQDALEVHEVPLEKLTDLIISHQDLDHIGNMPEVVANAPHVRVLTHELEKPFVQGEQPLLKYDVAEVEKLPAEIPQAFKDGLISLIKNPPQAQVDGLLADGDVLPIAGGMTVIFTPGHTPGHLSFYLHESKILIAADAMMVEDGRLNGPAPQATYDLALAAESLKKFTEYDVEKVVCYHGGLYEDAPNTRIRELAGG